MYRLALPRMWGILLCLESAPEFRIKLTTACFFNILKMHAFHKTLGAGFHYLCLLCLCSPSLSPWSRHTIAWSCQVMWNRVRQSAIQFSHRCECSNNPKCNQKSQDSKGNYRFWKETWLGLYQKLGSQGVWSSLLWCLLFLWFVLPLPNSRESHLVGPTGDRQAILLWNLLGPVSGLR